VFIGGYAFDSAFFAFWFDADIVVPLCLAGEDSSLALDTVRFWFMLQVMKIAFIGVALCSLWVLAFSSDLYYLDEPAPVSLKHAEYMVTGRLHSNGGLIARAAVGLFDRFTLGLSYGADVLIGHGTPQFTQPVGVQIRVLGLEEGSWYPSLLGGYDNQGFDGWSASSRYRTLPQGAYLVLGKTIWSSRTELSAGANYLPSYGFDGHLAVREFVFPDWDVLLEYDLGTNDGVIRAAHPGFPVGLLNFGIAAVIAGNLNLKLGLRDILGARKPSSGTGDADFQIDLNRVFDISFQQHF
jgi:hypothetical protein